MAGSMLQSDEATRSRDAAQEERERRRYELLERVYLLTGTDCESGVYAQEVTEQFGGCSGTDAVLARELAQLGFLRSHDDDSHFCITRRGVAFMQQEAWRRRSIRDD